MNIEKCINTVFDEEDYTKFVELIETAIQYFTSKRKKVTLDMVHCYLAEKVWSALGITGIIFDDKPTNPKNKKRIYSQIPDLYYKKRIQMVIFNLKDIRKFELHLENQK